MCNPAPQDNLAIRQHGAFRFAIQAAYLEGLPARIVAAGGKPCRMVTVEDPFGLVFELCSHSYEMTRSAGAYA